MVSAVLLSVGIVSILGAYNSISRNQMLAIESEHMQRLALDKYEELAATEALQTQSLNGDFSDRGDDNYLWEVSVAATGVDNLSAVTVTVTPRQDDGNKGVVTGVIYQAPQTTSTGTGATP
jgi:hypothetical protein